MRARIISMVVLAASLLVAGQSWAQSDGAATFGSQWWSQNNREAKFQEYRDLPRGGYLENYVLREFNGPYAAVLWGNEAMTHNQGSGFSLAKGITWRVDAQYAETPHNFSFVAVSPFAQVAPGVFVLPDSVQWDNERTILPTPDSTGKYVGNMRNVYASAPGAPLGLRTDVSRARFRARPIKDWQFEVRGSERQRQGSLAYGVSSFGTSDGIELPSPINQRTVDVDAFANYAHGPAKVMGSVGISDFHNRVPTMTWDNPKALRDTSYSVRNATGALRLNHIAGMGRMAMAPDNRVVRGNGAFSLKLPYSSTFTATLGLSLATQEQAFIPITINAKQFGGGRGDTTAGIMGNSLAALPAQNLGGRVLTIVQDYRLTGRPLHSLYSTLRLRTEKLDDQTPELAFLHGISYADQSLTVVSATAPAPVSEPWGNTKTVFGFDADYSINRYADVSFLAEHRASKHPLREVGKDAENVFGGGLRLNPMDNFSLTANYKWAKRTQEDTAFVDIVTSGDRLALRRFDVASRDQSVFTSTATWSPSEKMDVSISGWWNKDTYPDTRLGLKSSANSQLFGEAGLHPNSNVDITGGFGYGLLKTQQLGGEGGTLVDPAAGLPWKSDVIDKNVYAFAHASWWATPKKLQFGTQYTFTRDLQNNVLWQPPEVNLDLPAAYYRSHDVTVDAHWYYATGLDFGCRYGYTTYDVDDALLQTVPYLNVITTSPLQALAATSLYMGNNKLSYKASRVQVFATRRF